MDIKVRVPIKRRCPASIDILSRDLAVLSFGDLHKPDTDVEVEFNLKQMKRLKKVVDKGIEVWEKSLDDFIVEGKTHIQQPRQKHLGSC